MLIVGEQEANNRTVAVRRQGKGDLGAMAVNDFPAFFNEQIRAEEDEGN